jgi:hypothetical protein
MAIWYHALMFLKTHEIVTETLGEPAETYYFRENNDKLKLGHSLKHEVVLTEDHKRIFDRIPISPKPPISLSELRVSDTEYNLDDLVYTGDIRKLYGN